jgi:uncharacterized protein YllA (UPF0747 family)
MSDKLDQADETIDIFDQVVRERDELRAKVERHERRFREAEAEWVDRFQTLEAEIERLQAEVERLSHPTESVNLNNQQVRYREWRAAGMPDESSQT